MRHVWSAEVDDRTSAQLVAAKLMTNGFRWFVCVDGCTEAQAAEYVAALQALGCEAYADDYLPPPTTNHGYRTLTTKEREALAARQRVENPDSPVVFTGTAKSIPTEVYGRYETQAPASIRVLARWTGAVNPATAGPDLRGRRLAGRK